MTAVPTSSMRLTVRGHPCQHERRRASTVVAKPGRRSSQRNAAYCDAAPGADGRARVVQQALAFEDDEQAMRRSGCRSTAVAAASGGATWRRARSRPPTACRNHQMHDDCDGEYREQERPQPCSPRTPLIAQVPRGGVEGCVQQHRRNNSASAAPDRARAGVPGTSASSAPPRARSAG